MQMDDVVMKTGCDIPTVVQALAEAIIPGRHLG